MLWLAMFEVISNGPDPTGFVPKPAYPSAAAAVGLTMPRNAWLAASRKPGSGFLKLTVTLYGPLTTESSYEPSRVIANSDPSAGFSMRSNVYFTAAALSGVPSLNVTPLRMVNVYEVALLFTVQLEASQGEN